MTDAEFRFQCLRLAFDMKTSDSFPTDPDRSIEDLASEIEDWCKAKDEMVTPSEWKRVSGQDLWERKHPLSGELERWVGTRAPTLKEYVDATSKVRAA